LPKDPSFAIPVIDIDEWKDDPFATVDIQVSPAPAYSR